MTASTFDDDSAIELLDSTDSELSGTSARTWRGRLSSRWSIGQVPNGGYTAAVALRGLLAHTEHDTALSLTTHYYSPTIADHEFTLRTEIKRLGRTTTHADATLLQDDKVRLRCVGVLGEAPAGDVLFPALPADVPGPAESSERDPLAQGLNMTLLESLEVRLHPDTPLPVVNDRPRIEGWVRFRDQRVNDALALCLFADSFPPAILSAVPETGWVPTIELTTHMRAAAAPGWIRGEVTTTNVRDGYLVEDIRLWDSTNTLVVEARQLALLRT